MRLRAVAGRFDAACIELASGAATWCCAAAPTSTTASRTSCCSPASMRCRPPASAAFDAGADGIALGEGVACVVLKRLADAGDGDRIYGIVKAVGASSDGRSLGLTAPRQDGQERAVRAAPTRRLGCAPRGRAHRGPRDRHGGGRPDRAVDAHRGVLDRGHGPRRVRGGIGEVRPSATPSAPRGLAGLVKAAKAVYHGVHPAPCNICGPTRFGIRHQPVRVPGRGPAS